MFVSPIGASDWLEVPFKWLERTERTVLLRLSAYCRNLLFHAVADKTLPTKGEFKMHFPALRFWRTVADFDSSRESRYLLSNRRIDETGRVQILNPWAVTTTILWRYNVCISQRPSLYHSQSRPLDPRYTCTAEGERVEAKHGPRLSMRGPRRLRMRVRQLLPSCVALHFRLAWQTCLTPFDQLYVLLFLPM